MKKLKLKALSLGAREILNREQLKQVNGGSTVTGCCWLVGGYCYSETEYPLRWECIDGNQYCATFSEIYPVEYNLGCHD